MPGLCDTREQLMNFIHLQTCSLYDKERNQFDFLLYVKTFNEFNEFNEKDICRLLIYKRRWKINKWSHIWKTTRWKWFYPEYLIIYDREFNEILSPPHICVRSLISREWFIQVHPIITYHFCKSQYKVNVVYNWFNLWFL